MPSIKIFTEYSYQILNDDGGILESNSGFDDLNECVADGIKLLKLYEEETDGN